MRSRGLNVEAKRESGVAAVMTVLLAVVLLGSVAMAVDVGNAYQYQRKAQNAADAAAFAGVEKYQQLKKANPNWDGYSQLGEPALDEAQRYAEDNFSVTDAQWADCKDAGHYLWVSPISECLSLNPTTPVQVRVRIPGDVGTAFGKAVGVRILDASALSEVAGTTPSRSTISLGGTTTTSPPTTTDTTIPGQTSTTTTSTTVVAGPTCDLYPIAFHLNSMTSISIGTSVDIYNGGGPGNFGWATWSGAQAQPVLAASLQTPNSNTYINPTNSSDHVLNVGDELSGKVGVVNSSAVRSALDALIGRDISVPVWDTAVSQGANLRYHVIGFALVRISSYRLPGQTVITATYRGPSGCGATPTGFVTTGPTTTTTTTRPAVTTTSTTTTSTTTTTTTPPTSRCGLYALNDSFTVGFGSATLDVSGQANWSVSGCVRSNGTLKVQSPNVLSTPSAIAANWIHCNRTQTEVCGSPSDITGTIQPDRGVIADPLAGLADPPSNGLVQSFDNAVSVGGGIIDPGTYRGPYTSLAVTGSVISLRPGNYIFIDDQNPVDVSATVRNTTGQPQDGVTLFFKGAGERLRIRPSGSLQLRAPSTGTYANVLIYFERNQPNASFRFATAASSLQGTVYLPQSYLRLETLSAWSTSSRFVVGAVSSQDSKAAMTISVTESTNRSF